MGQRIEWSAFADCQSMSGVRGRCGRKNMKSSLSLVFSLLFALPSSSAVRSACVCKKMWCTWPAVAHLTPSLILIPNTSTCYLRGHRCAAVAGRYGKSSGGKTKVPRVSVVVESAKAESMQCYDGIVPHHGGRRSSYPPFH